jgi:tetratricopeptide (TPR) repeat protein
MRIIGAAAVIFLSLTSAAHAQWALQSGAQGRAGLGIVEYQTRDWAQCGGEEQVPPARAIAACGRIVGERFSREATAEAYYRRARLYQGQGDAEHAQQDFRHCLETLSSLIASHPDDTRFLNNRAGLRMELGDTEGAIADYQRLAVLQPNDPNAQTAVAGMMFRRGDYPGAIRAFDAVAQANPGLAAAHAGRCEARAAARTDLDVAQQACEEALRLSDDSSASLFSRGFLRFVQGDMRAAAADFRAAGEKDNTNPYAAYGYGVVGVRLGHEQEGRELIAQVSAAVPDVETYAAAGMRP